MTNEKQPPDLMQVVPYVVEKTRGGDRVYDIYTRLLEDRIIFVGSPINDPLANTIVAQLLYLQYKDQTKDITMFINSPGGIVNSALAIYDTMQYVKPDIVTVGFGMVASAASVLLSAGTRGKRRCLPNTEVMLHQVSGGAEGTAIDIEIAAKQVIKTKQRLNEILALHTGQPLSVIEKDTDRDFWMSPTEAKQYGLIDEIIPVNDDKLRKPAPRAKAA